MAQRIPKNKFTKYTYDKHRKLLAETPERAAQRQQDIFNRNQMFASTQAYTLRLEKQRVQSHISDFAGSLQQAMAQHHMGDLDCRIHKFASSGLP